MGFYRGTIWVFIGLLGTATLASATLASAASSQRGQYAGSESCRSCHERFYQLWAPSHHGTAMVSYTEKWASDNIQSQKKPLTIAGKTYQAFVGKGEGWVLQGDGKKETKMPITHVLGGKYVFYFLAQQQGGKLQTLPVAYDIKEKIWFDMAASGVRHGDDDPVDWQDSVYTFNTSCYGCHVSQVDNDYNPKTKVYSTKWAEDGINCESCHGPAAEHIALFESLPKDAPQPKNNKLLGGKGKFTAQENIDACIGCHSQSIPISKEYVPGEKFYDHYDLTTLEDEDFYPDGRDLGENYTYGTWSMSPCLASKELSCITCHTSSGRFRQKKDPNQACLPCHSDKGEDLSAHTHHLASGNGSVCISCHMVKTTFARMDRSDHSMLPPTPAASLAFGSANACTVCHTNKDDAWADKNVREWKGDSYQNLQLYRGSLVAEARKGDWRRLSEMLAYISDPEANEIFANSLVRLLESCDDSRKWPVLLKALENKSPLMRSSAATALGANPSRDVASALVLATQDRVRLVRIRAASSLASMPIMLPRGELQRAVDKATNELLDSLVVRPDMWNSYYNLGNFYTKKKEIKKAIEAYQQALDIAPRAVAPRVNMAILYGGLGEMDKAKAALEKAYSFEPQNPSVLFNLALVHLEYGDSKAAENYFRLTLKENPNFSRAASNLAILVGKESPADAVAWAKKAYDLAPTPVSAFTLGYYMKNSGAVSDAYTLVFSAIKRWPNYSDLYLLQGELAQTAEQKQQVKEMTSKALNKYRFHPEDQKRLEKLCK